MKKEGGKAIEQNLSDNHNSIIVIASSTGGPSTLTNLLSEVPGDLKIPILVVQHMPEKYTALFAGRLNDKCELSVKEAETGDCILPGHVYLAKGGKHMRVYKTPASHLILLTDEPFREGVKPCANYTYESLAGSGYSKVYCIVLTGMGCDGTEGITYLSEFKETEIWIQDKESCVVFGMPGSIAKSKLKHETLSLKQMVEKIKNI